MNTKNVFCIFRYKFHLFVKDESDSCTVMMLDSVAQSIIGSAAAELKETYIFTTKVKCVENTFHLFVKPNVLITISSSLIHTIFRGLTH